MSNNVNIRLISLILYTSIWLSVIVDIFFFLSINGVHCCLDSYFSKYILNILNTMRGLFLQAHTELWNLLIFSVRLCFFAALTHSAFKSFCKCKVLHKNYLQVQWMWVFKFIQTNVSYSFANYLQKNLWPQQRIK